MRVFVTGATGFLGRHLVEHLLAQGDEVTALARTFDRARALPAGVRAWAGDVARPASLRAGMRAGTGGAEVIYHLAAAREPGRRARDLSRLDRINVDGARAVLALAGELGVGRMVYVSDLAVAGPAGAEDSPYAASKRRGHAAAREAMRAGAPVTIVSLGTLVGAGDGGWQGRWLGQPAYEALRMGGGSAAPRLLRCPPPRGRAAKKSHSWTGFGSCWSPSALHSIIGGRCPVHLDTNGRLQPRRIVVASPVWGNAHRFCCS